MAVSTPLRGTPAIAAVKIVTRLVTMKSMGMEHRHINVQDRDFKAICVKLLLTSAYLCVFLCNKFTAIGGADALPMAVFLT